MAFGMNKFENIDGEMEMSQDQRRREEAQNAQSQADAEYESAQRQNAQLAGKGWADVQREQMQRGQAQEVSFNQQKWDQYNPIVESGDQAEAMDEQNRVIAGAYMIADAYKRGGISSRHLGNAFTQVFGRPVYGAQILSGLEGDDARYNGNIGIYGAVQNPTTGKVEPGLIGMMSPEDQIRLLQKAKCHDRTVDAERAIYGELSKKLTADQLLQKGIQNPDGPYVAGGVSGKNVARLFGRTGPTRSTVSVFGTGSGYSKTKSPDGQWEVDDPVAAAEAMRKDDPNYAGNWKQTGIGPASNDPNDRTQVRTYENSKTGQTVRVRDGETLQGVLARGSEKVQAAQVTQGGKEELERMRLKLKEYGINIDAQIKERELGLKEQALAGKGGAFDPKEYESLSKSYNAIRDSIMLSGGSASKEDKELLDALRNRLKGMIGGGTTENHEGGDIFSKGVGAGAGGNGGVKSTPTPTPTPTPTQQTVNPPEDAEAKRKAAEEAAKKKKRDQEWGATTLADGYSLSDEEFEREDGSKFRNVIDKGGNVVGRIGEDGTRSDGDALKPVDDDKDAAWQDEGRTTQELKRRFVANGGKVNDDGSFTVDGLEYLSGKELDGLDEGSSDAINRRIVRAQALIAKRRKEIAQRTLNKEKALHIEARKKFRGNDKKQREWVEKMLNVYKYEVDPEYKKASDFKKELTNSFRLR